MHIRKSLWLLTFLLIGVLSLQAERVFILFDENCMDRLEYQQIGQTEPYVIYQVNVAQGERVILEVGQEAGEFRGNLPSPLVNCYTGVFDQKMVDNINNNTDEIFVVKPLSNGKYTRSKVSVAAFYQYDDRTVTYNSPKFRFDFDIEFGVIGVNIAPEDNPGEVTFEGRMERGCLGAYIFRQFEPKSKKPLLDMVLVPEVGIIAEGADFSPSSTAGLEKKLLSVNKTPLEIKIQEECNRRLLEANTSNPSLTAYNTEAVPSPVFSEIPDMQVKGSTPVSQSAAPKIYAGPVKKHKIVKGDNLLRLAMKYDVSITELKEWNGLTSNTIYRGKELIVSDPGPPPTADLQPVNAVKEIPAATVPASYNSIGNDVNVKGAVPVSSPTHTVRTGDTVASIAMKYGLTEARLRELNGLAPNDYPRIGQALVITDPQNPATNPVVNPQTANVDPFGSIPTPNSLNQTPINVPSTPVSNYSYPSSSLYGNDQIANTNSMPFSSQLDTPVPSSNSSTAPTNYSTAQGNGGSAITPYQPTPYSVPNSTNTTNLNGLSSTSGNDASTQGNKRSHIVQEGENLHDIARRYGMTVQQLGQLNRMDTNEIVIPGQKLYLE